MYRNTCQIKRQPCQLDRPVIASTTVITARSNSIYLLSLIISFWKLKQLAIHEIHFSASYSLLLFGSCLKVKTVSFLTQGKVHESF